MLILNSKKDNLFKCGNLVHNYLQGKVSMFNMDNDWYYYKDTKELREIISSAPFWVRMVAKCNN